MSDYEQIILVGGPADGRMMPWDGGDYVGVPAPLSPFKISPYASKAYKELLLKSHTYTYRRDGVNDHGYARFVWMGEPK